MKALEMAGGVHGLAHRRLIDVLNNANITKLCSLKGIGKQVWVREMRERARETALNNANTSLNSLASLKGIGKQVCVCV
jgi:hypothetical protein